MAATAGEGRSAEERLEIAVLELLERDGVLAGINLREVAERAEVTRGLVYHHFGSRRELLRSALKRVLGRRRSTVLRLSKIPPRDRLSQYLQEFIANPTPVQLLALLVLDGDRGFDALPFSDLTREVNRQDIADGLLAGDVDEDALQGGLLAAVYGWVLLRRAFASSLGRSPEELDPYVLEMLHRMQTPSGD